MSEFDGLTVHHEEFSRAVGQYALLTNKSLEEQFFDQVRRVVQEIVANTPPLGRSGSKTVTNSNVKRVLENRVRQNLRMFRPVDLKGKREVPLLFGKEHPGAPWSVPTKERHPDVEAIWAAHQKEQDYGRRYRNFKRGFYVDRKKLNRLVDKEIVKFGKLVAGFKPVAVAQRVSVPAIARRHPARGSYSQRITPGMVQAQFTNALPYAANVPGFKRRIDNAVRARIGAMERQIPFLLRRHQRLVN